MGSDYAARVYDRMQRADRRRAQTVSADRYAARATLSAGREASFDFAADLSVRQRMLALAMIAASALNHASRMGLAAGMSAEEIDDLIREQVEAGA